MDRATAAQNPRFQRALTEWQKGRISLPPLRILGGDPVTGAGRLCAIHRSVQDWVDGGLAVG